MHARSFHRALAVAGAIAIATAAAVTGASPASATPGAEIDYQATGSTTLANPNSKVTVNFKPAILQSFVTFNDDNTASIKAFLPLAPVSASFKAYGFLPSRGTVVFTQVGPETGVLGPYNEETGFPLSVTARYVVSLRDVYIGGKRANVGTNCQSVYPVKVTITAEPGFDLVNGTLDGSYNLSNFNNCGQAQNIINDTLPGPGNTLTLNITLDDGSKRAAASTARTLGKTH